MMAEPAIEACLGVKTGRVFKASCAVMATLIAPTIHQMSSTAVSLFKITSEFASRLTNQHININ
jgi:hypothetical protein